MKTKITCIPEETETTRKELEKALQQGAYETLQWFGRELDNIELEVYTSRLTWQEQHTRLSEEELATWVAGDSGRIIRVVAACSKQHLLNMVAHECVHHIIHKWVIKLPAWLDEGIAIFLLLGMPKKYERELAAAIDHDQALIPFEMLENSFSGLSRDIKELAYAQSVGLVRHIAEEHGRQTLRSILASLAAGNSLKQSLRPLGLNMYLLEQGMIRSCLRKKRETEHV